MTDALTVFKVVNNVDLAFRTFVVRLFAITDDARMLVVESAIRKSEPYELIYGICPSPSTVLISKLRSRFTFMMASSLKYKRLDGNNSFTWSRVWSFIVSVLIRTVDANNEFASKYVVFCLILEI